ncbi:MAG: glycosyltransferase [Bacteroidetes bacterium]|nr:MAG: glycosyltransferase [Bacteroidota bacterium]
MTRYLQEKTLFGPQISSRVATNLGLIIVIPCSDEEALLLSLMSLKKCSPPNCSVEVIVVINHSETADNQVVHRNNETYKEAISWAEMNSSPEFKFHILFHGDLPRKHAGVGLARKIGMDEAAWRLEKVGNPHGVIVCFDADSRCDRNYLTSIEKHFQSNSKTTACGIHFEHPLSGLDFDEEIYHAITLYELHLRYYVHAQQFSGFPFAHQTIGSSMAVRAIAYQRQGGMNKRKAGEDFYFLHKFIELGNFTTIKTTKVIPSPRPSHRVPFGTGKAVGQLLKNKMEYKTYAPESFVALKTLFEHLPQHYSLDAEQVLSNIAAPIAAFLPTVNFKKKWDELHQHTGDFTAFEKRFFRWFNAFMLMKYVHYSRDHFHPDVDVVEASKFILEQSGNQVPQEAKKQLLVFRQLDLAQ